LFRSLLDTFAYFIRYQDELYRILSVRDSQGRGMYVEVLADKDTAAKS